MTEERSHRFPNEPCDFVANPDLVLSNIEYGVESAFVYWSVTRDVNCIADFGNIRDVTEKLNGGLNGYAQRKSALNKLADILEIKKDECKKFSCATLALSILSLTIDLSFLPREAVAECPEIKKSTVFDSRQFINDSRISIEPSDTANALSLNIYTNCQSSHKKIEVATFQTEGSAPHVESVFFQKIRGRENVFAIVSWKINSRGDGTYGMYYEVHAYQEDSDGVISENHVVSGNQYMSGIDGYQMGQESTFPYKTAIDVRGFWRKKR